ncbi:uncharacterized protein BO88DRAFT_94668 [Aspergillus vadensis CBS 113365]|uniref:Uncharacterized protein n=1 Tax=Aspergillus vadensis (strain CBS 113365 / IMI 142717 / IBT 24658) TaxID=1448311 RepID=A0A319BJN0_ASPVC|nr:hypothetical protein BO88DRAFT_94668 [Aspergillus vadensis CBS 113365]PYH73416.1 hypothetical protein BO88DRAFT_94668 [Aspergillus vadensis CBS 113365]
MGNSDQSSPSPYSSRWHWLPTLVMLPTQTTPLRRDRGGPCGEASSHARYRQRGAMGGGRRPSDPGGRKTTVTDGIEREALLSSPNIGSSVKPVSNKVTHIQARWLYSPSINSSKKRTAMEKTGKTGRRGSSDHRLQLIWKRKWGRAHGKRRTLSAISPSLTRKLGPLVKHDQGPPLSAAAADL